eukprot:4547134-Pleurochrysis_carterae.AAC.2
MKAYWMLRRRAMAGYLRIFDDLEEQSIRKGDGKGRACRFIEVQETSIHGQTARNCCDSLTQGVLAQARRAHPQKVENSLDLVAAKDAEDAVFEREEEVGGAGVALPPGAAAQLVVDTARVVQ